MWKLFHSILHLNFEDHLTFAKSLKIIKFQTFPVGSWYPTSKTAYHVSDFGNWMPVIYTYDYEHLSHLSLRYHISYLAKK
jgi:hypothetical protein